MKFIILQRSLFIPEITTTTEIIKETFTISTLAIEKPFDWMGLLFTIYKIGVIVFSLKFIIEIISLIYLIYKNPKSKQGKYTYVETQQITSPFSFFVWIVFNRNHFTEYELLQIIHHEKVHVTHWHSVDMILIQLLAIVQWFNPFIWLYQKEL